MITGYSRAPPPPPSPHRGGRPHPICKVLHSRLAPPPLLRYPAAPSVGVSDPMSSSPLLPRNRALGIPWPRRATRRPAPGCQPSVSPASARPELGGSRRAQAGWLAGWLALSIARSLARSRLQAAAPGVGDCTLTGGEAEKHPGKAAELRGSRGARRRERRVSYLHLGRLWVTFQVRGKNVCVFGMERRGRACAAQSCRIPDFSLPVSALARCDYGILRGRAGEWVACKTRAGSRGRAPLHPHTPRPSPPGFFPPTAPAELCWRARLDPACGAACERKSPFCGWRSLFHPRLSGVEAGGQERRDGSRLLSTCSEPCEPLCFPLFH